MMVPLWILLQVSGCGIASRTRPLDLLQWPPGIEPIPWLVVVDQVREGGGVVGTGSIVHSSLEQGTYVLTAFHVVEGSEDPGVWVWDESSGRPDCIPGYRRIQARVVVPERQASTSWFEPGWMRASRELEGAFHKFLTDFAILKLETDELFPVLPAYSGSPREIPPGAPVRLAAIHPERFPHFHEFAWRRPVPEGVLLPGHSGAPVLFEGEWFYLVTGHGSVPGQFEFNVGVDEIREELTERGLEFLPGGPRSHVLPAGPEEDEVPPSCTVPGPDSG